MKHILILLFLLPVCLYSINVKKMKHTASGIYYKIYTNDSSKVKPVYGDHIWMHLRKYGLKGKEVFNTRIFDVNNGVEMEFKKPEKKADVTEIFSLMGIGDSALVMIPGKLLDSNARGKKYFSYQLNLINFKTKDAYQYEKNEHAKLQLILDSLSIADYIRNNDLHDCTADAYGNWFLRKQKGNGPMVHGMDSVTIHYIGRLTNNKEFDNSYERKQTFSFVVGKKQVIEGLDKGIQNFYHGDKGLLLIPSRLAYGDKEVGKIPANSVLVFEFEIMP